ncbi:MAG: hypothetical protein AAFR76_05020 [Planctomycetota bacterium]
MSDDGQGTAQRADRAGAEEDDKYYTKPSIYEQAGGKSSLYRDKEAAHHQPKNLNGRAWFRLRHAIIPYPRGSHGLSVPVQHHFTPVDPKLFHFSYLG